MRAKVVNPKSNLYELRVYDNRATADLRRAKASALPVTIITRRARRFAPKWLLRAAELISKQKPRSVAEARRLALGCHPTEQKKCKAQDETNKSKSAATSNRSGATSLPFLPT